MSRVAETQHCVKNITSEQTKAARIRELIAQGLPNRAIADAVGCRRETVTTVRCRPLPQRHGPTQGDRIRELMGQGYSDQGIASLTGYGRDYIRAVRSRQRRKLGAGVVPIRGRFPTRHRPPPGNTPAELHELAQTLYRWRQDGRFA